MHNAATASLLLGIDAVLDAEASCLDSIVENGGVLIVASASEVHDTVRVQDVLCATGCVLGSTAGDELGVVVVEEVFVDAEVLVLGKDGVIGLEFVLV